VRAVDGVDFTLNEGDTLGIVGESGCGKTVLALSIMRLIPVPPGRIVSGSVLFEGADLIQLSEPEMRKVRGKRISMIFQEPMTSLNPVFRVGEQIAEAVELHLGLSKKDALDHAVKMLQLVGMPSPQERILDYPHQMSGGMRQRVMIAMALSCNPRLMLADEPTTALDVTIQAQILDLINRLKGEVGTSVMLITHDLGVIAEAAQFAAVMYAGKIVEYGSVGELFSRPLHPYTVGLMNSIPKIGEDSGEGHLRTIAGTVPSLYELPAGCSFRDRCPDVMAVCAEQKPELIEQGPGHWVRCWKYSG
jgi:peptide/nickel transport system ATP-binding protein/oligopeptide transport system ATP-binding protein